MLAYSVLSIRRRDPAGRSRRGFTIVEILVGLAIFAVLTAVLLTNLGGFQEKSRITEIVQTLRNVAMAIREYKRVVGVYPDDLMQLYTRPGATDDDLCGNDIGAAAVNRWSGPYVDRTIQEPWALVIGNDTIVNDLDREPSPAANTIPPIYEAGKLQIYVRNVPSDVALLIDAELDGDGSLTEGQIQWTVFPGFPRLVYSLAVSGC